jgi:signal transduction histidine kinase
MRLRVLLALQLLLALVAISVFVFFTVRAFWLRYGPYVPHVVPVAGAEVSITDVAATYGFLLLILATLVFMLVYLVLNRSVINPIKTITKAMTTFSESSTFTPFQGISFSSAEIRELTNAFVEFTDNVEQVHARDMEISRVKSDFISTAAHQLRTPLTGIRWALEALAKDPLTEQQRALVEDAANKSRDLVAIVGTLLDISSIESGKHKYVFEPIQLEELAEGVTRDFGHQAGERQVSLSFEPCEHPLPKVRADREQIKWILNNLIENAVKYTPEGGTVRISMAQVPDRVQVLVHDTGIGITPKDRNNIFERFYRAENAVAKENKGNGLGLYIARTIATDHGGDLNFAANETGPGTTFTLSLPTV